MMYDFPFLISSFLSILSLPCLFIYIWLKCSPSFYSFAQLQYCTLTFCFLSCSYIASVSRDKGVLRWSNNFLWYQYHICAGWGSQQLFLRQDRMTNFLNQDIDTLKMQNMQASTHNAKHGSFLGHQTQSAWTIIYIAHPLWWVYCRGSSGTRDGLPELSNKHLALVWPSAMESDYQAVPEDYDHHSRVPSFCARAN